MSLLKIQNQPPRGFLRKRCFKNMKQICRRTPILKCDFNNVALRLIEIILRQECSAINLLHIFRTPFIRTHLGGCFWKYNATHVVKCSTHYNPETKYIQNCSLNISPPSSLIVTTIFNISDNNIPRSVENATLTRSKKENEIKAWKIFDWDLW